MKGVLFAVVNWGPLNGEKNNCCALVDAVSVVDAICCGGGTDVDDSTWRRTRSVVDHTWQAAQCPQQ